MTREPIGVGVGFFTDYRSVALHAGCRVIPSPEGGGPLGFPVLKVNNFDAIGPELELAKLRMQVRPLEFDIPEGATLDDVFAFAAKRIDQLVLSTVIRDTTPMYMEENWQLRMVATVEEANAEFEGFVTNTLPDGIDDNPSGMCGYPVHYSDAVPEGTVLGGMWSDGLILLEPKVTVRKGKDKTVGVIRADFVMRHKEAFVRAEGPK